MLLRFFGRQIFLLSNVEYTNTLLQVNLNISEAEEKVILEETLGQSDEEGDSSDKSFREKESLQKVGIDKEKKLVEEELGDVEEVEVEEESLWDEEKEVVWDLGRTTINTVAKDDDGRKGSGGRVYFPVPQLLPLLPAQDDAPMLDDLDKEKDKDAPMLEDKDKEKDAQEDAPMLDDLPLLYWSDQKAGADEGVVESNTLEEQGTIFVEEDLSQLSVDNFAIVNQSKTSWEEDYDRVTMPMKSENLGPQIGDDDNEQSNLTEDTTAKNFIITVKKYIADSESEKTNEEESVLGQAEEKRTDAEPRSIENTGRAQNTQNTGDVQPAAKVVETQDGLVQGVEGRTDEGKVFHKYLGVPYAAPPVGSLRSSLDILKSDQHLYLLCLLRFQRPERHQGWKGFPAGWAGVECLQVTVETCPYPCPCPCPCP